MILEYVNTYHEIPPKSVMREHFWLFEDNYDELIPEFQEVMGLVDGSFEKSKIALSNNKKKFDNFEKFLSDCNFDLDEKIALMKKS